jgi:adenosylcobinamide kinase / adenosylcobinamide-phosphate guanylyltransferase
LILGGARSGKSAFGMRLATECRLTPWVVATAQASDAEMEQRIAHHRAERDETWRVAEAPFRLCDALGEVTRPDRIVLVDCLTVWLSNLFFKEFNERAEVARLAAWLPKSSGPVIFISNELGMGLVPETTLGRRFRDAHGRMNQELAAICDEVTLVAAGLPLTLKSSAR